MNDEFNATDKNNEYNGNSSSENNDIHENYANDEASSQKQRDDTNVAPKDEVSWSNSEYSFKPQSAVFDPVPQSVRDYAEKVRIDAVNDGETDDMSSNEGKRCRRESKCHTKLSLKTISLMLVVCIIVSAAAGFGGAYIGNKVYGSSSGSFGGNDGPSFVYKEAPSTENVGKTDFAISNVVEAVENTVVEIVTEEVVTNSFYGQYVSKGAGSGVIISEDGYIVTCAHVVEGASTVTVTLKDKNVYDAKIIGSDSRTDVALLKIEATGLTVAVIGDSDSLVIGEPAIAIGNPLGELGGTVTDGIISALEREVEIDGTAYTLLQTNAAINPGNSGGALFDINGTLIGIINAKQAGETIEGLGFAIPINAAMEVVGQLKEYGYVKGRPQFGVYLYDVSDSESYSALRGSEYSALINYVTDFGVYFIKYMDGQTGGLKFGDRIVAVDGVSISNTSDLKSILNEYSVGDEIILTVSRRDESSKLNRNVMVDVSITLMESTAQN